jgi:hypothetical protein
MGIDLPAGLCLAAGTRGPATAAGLRPPFRPRASAASKLFHRLPAPGIVAKAEETADWVQASGGKATLFTNGRPARAAAANRVFNRAGFGAGGMGKLTLAEGGNW